MLNKCVEWNNGDINYVANGGFYVSCVGFEKCPLVVTIRFWKSNRRGAGLSRVIEGRKFVTFILVDKI